MTKDAKTVLYHMYKEYLVLRSNHLPKSKAKRFDSTESIQKALFPDWCIEDIDEALRELEINGYVNNNYASEIIYECELTDNAISVMENQNKEKLLSALDFISKFIP